MPDALRITFGTKEELSKTINLLKKFKTENE